LPKRATNKAIAPLISANAPRNCAITTEKNRGEPIAKKPTKRERIPPAISQPRLMERASRAVAGETFVVIERNLQAIRDEKGEQFFKHKLSAETL
jgi:hypothetical protein